MRYTDRENPETKVNISSNQISTWATPLIENFIFLLECIFHQHAVCSLLYKTESSSQDKKKKEKRTTTAKETQEDLTTN